MINNTGNWLMRGCIRAKKMHTADWRCSITRSLLPICLLLISCACGCSGEVQPQELQVHLSSPVIDGKAVSVNGGVPVPLERIQWEWGDGQVDKHLFFPASHSYIKPGTYNITVTVFGKNNARVSKSISVEIQ